MYIEGPVGFVVSAGRTGTAFFGERLNEVFPDTAAFHEPDTINQRHFLHDLTTVVRRFGVYQGVIGKAFGRTGLRNVADRFVAGRISESEAIEQFLEHRARFYQTQRERFVIESNYALFPLLPLLPKLVKQYRVVAITRDPESWIRSYMRKDDRYGSKDFLQVLGQRISPERIQDEATLKEWPRMATNERLAWFWQLVYGRIAAAADQDDNIRIFRFEDLFYSDEREKYFLEMATFLKGIAGDRVTPRVPAGFLDDVRNASPNPKSPIDGEEIAAAAAKWCDPLRQRWDYPVAR